MPLELSRLGRDFLPILRPRWQRDRGPCESDFAEVRDREPAVDVLRGGGPDSWASWLPAPDLPQRL